VVVHKVGDQKRKKGLAVHDPKREEALLRSLVARAPSCLDEQAVRAIFEAIVGQSRRLEEEML
jgi:chorismate mutase